MTTKKKNQWMELLEAGGADTFFDSFANDQELADQMNLAFKDEVVTVDQIRLDRQRFHTRPKRGKEDEEKENSPSKNVILNKASQLNVKEALAEIIDNIFDNYERNDTDSLNIDIVVYPKTYNTPGEIIVTENSGGIEKARIIPLIQLGFSERTARGIGAWGEGFKMAVFALGEEVEVFTTYPGSKPIAIHFPRGWLDPNDNLWEKWKVNTYEIQKNSPPEGTTILRVNYIHSEVLKSFGLIDGANEDDYRKAVLGLTKYFGEVYAEKYHYLCSQDRGNITINININDIKAQVKFLPPVKQRLIKNLAFLPWLKPIHWKAKWETDIEEPEAEEKSRKAVLEVEIFAGIAESFSYSSRYKPQSPGVEMWGNGRLFTLKGRINDETVGWKYVFGGRAGKNPDANASSRRMIIVASFTAKDTRDIPWAAPVKNDYNRRSEFYAEIQLILAMIIRLYKDALRILEYVLAPYSHKWVNISDAEKLNIVFQNANASETFKAAFATSRFGRKFLDYQPEFTFKEITGSGADISMLDVQEISASDLKDLVNAASATKESPEKIVEFLYAIFPSLYKQAQLEEKFGLSPNEEIKL